MNICRVKFFVPFLGVTLLSCSGPEQLDSSRVDPDSIWGKYIIDFDSEAQTLTAVAQFRLKNEEGAVIRLKEPSSVSVEGQTLGLSTGQSSSLNLQGNFYSLNLASSPQLQQVTFTWTRPDSFKVTNVATILPALILKKDSVEAKISRRVNANVQIENWSALPQDASVTCLLQSRISETPADSQNQGSVPQAPGGAPVVPGVGTVVGAPAATSSPAPVPSSPNPSVPSLRELMAKVPYGASCLFSAEELQKFAVGPAKLRIISEKSQDGPNGHPKGGNIASRTWSQSLLIDVSE